MKSDKIRISEGYTHEGKIYHDVTIKGEEFKRVPNLSKCKYCTIRNCKYYQKCIEYSAGVVRAFDCQKNVAMVANSWNILTGILLASLATIYYKFLNLGIYKGTAILLVTVVALDVVCLVFEKLAEVFRDNYFYHKLKRRQAKQKAIEEKKFLKEKVKKMKEEVEEKNSNIVKIREAEAVLNQIEVISESFNFGECDEKIRECVKKCREIMQYLHKDEVAYIRVENLLQVYLPDFYRVLAYYAEFIKVDAVGEAQNIKFNDTVDFFYEFLSKQKTEVIFDKTVANIKFNNAADTLKKEIERRGGRL